jgi:hypothetical protein
MHLTLKKEATKPAASNFLQQQARFDKFIEIFNHERPHEALNMKCPNSPCQSGVGFPFSAFAGIERDLLDSAHSRERCHHAGCQCPLSERTRWRQQAVEPEATFFSLRLCARHNRSIGCNRRRLSPSDPKLHLECGSTARLACIPWSSIHHSYP